MTTLTQPAFRLWLAAPIVAVVAAATGWWAAGAWSHRRADTPGLNVIGPRLTAGAVTRGIETVLGEVARTPSSSKQFALLAATPAPRSAGALRAWLDRIESLPNVETRELAQRLLARGGSGIPFAEMAAVLDPSDDRAGGALARSWAEQEGLSSLARALSSGSGTLVPGFFSQMAGVCARTDPQGTLDLLLSHTGDRGRAEAALGSVFAEWVKQDPAQAAERLTSLTASQREDAAYYLADAWVRIDPTQALAWASGQTGQLRQTMLSLVLARWSLTDPRLAAEVLLKEAPETQGHSVWRNWSQRDPDGMLNWVMARTDLAEGTREEALGAAARSLVGTDPARAWSIAKDLPDHERSSILSDISADFLTKDPTAAIAWGTALSAASDRDLFFEAMGQLESTTPESQATLLELLPENDPAAVSGQLAMLSRADPAAAKQYWEALPPEMRASTGQALISGLVYTAPELAAAIVREKVEGQDLGSAPDPSPDPFANSDAMEASRVAVALAVRDPEAAKKWIASLPAGEAAAEAAANFATHHGRFDHAGVEEWLASEPDDSPLRSGLLRGLARLDTSVGDPNAALSELRQLAPEDPARSHALYELLNAWRATDAEAAKHAFDALPLTEAERTALGGAFDD